MGLLDGLFGGGGEEDDPYADILTPAQRRQMQTQGLLAMAGAFADAGMPSRLPIPFGAALGKAAAALGTGQEAGMTAALANAFKAQQVRDLRSKAALQAQLNPILKSYLTKIQAWQDSGGVGPPPSPPTAAAGPGGGGGGGAAPAADAPLMMDLPYPAARGGLLGGGDTDLTGGLPGNGGGLLGEGSGGGSGAADLGAGGDDATPVASVPPWATDPVNRGLRGDTTGQNAMARFRQAVFGGGEEPPVWGPTFPQGGAAARGETPEMTRLIEQAAAEQKISPDVLRGLLKTESGFNPNAVSPQGATGIAQLMPATARGLGVTDPTDVTQAIPAGARYLRAGLDASGGDINKALMYYHGGPDRSMWGPRTRAYPGAVLAAAGRTTEGSGGSTEPDPYANLTPRPAGAPLAAPSSGGVPALAPPGSLPQLAPPGSVGAPGSGGKIPGLNISPQELAVIDAMAESAGLGNPFKGLLETYYKSPGYLQESAGATARGKESVEFPHRQQLQNEKARSDLLQQMAKDALTLDDKGNVVEIPGMRGMLGKTAGEVEAAKERAKAQFALTEVPVIGSDGQTATEKMTVYEAVYRRQQAAERAAMGGRPQPGDIVGTPYTTPGQQALEASDIKVLEQKRTIADTARTTIQNANDLRAAIEQGVIAGTGADTRTQMLKLGQLLGITGADSNALIANTERYIASQGKNLKEGLAGLGPPISNNDTQIAERIAGGQMTTPQGMLEILRIREKYHRQAIVDYNRMASGLPASKIIGERTINEPPTYGAQTASGPNGQRVWNKDGNWVPY